MAEMISIIVPVYNVEKYLERCLNSILKQTYSEFEVVCVDDGSVDCSATILDDYQKKDSRFRVFHIENRGVGNARNYALSQIKGEWFAFLDADDWLEEDFLESLWENAKKYQCDISACMHILDRGNGVLNPNVANDVVVYHSAQECIPAFICGNPSLQGMVWNKLYKAEAFKDILFHTDIRVNEDCLYTFEIMQKCNNACVTRKPLYHWFFREDSACHTAKKKADFTEANVFLMLLNGVKEMQNETVNMRLKRNYVLAVLKIIWNMKYENNREVKEARARVKGWKKDVYRMLDKKKKVKYFLTIDAPWILKIVKR